MNIDDPSVSRRRFLTVAAVGGLISGSSALIAADKDEKKDEKKGEKEKKYDAEHHAECERIKDMNIDPPWYRPPTDGLAAAKTWSVASFAALLVSLGWLYAVAA